MLVIDFLWEPYSRHTCNCVHDDPFPPSPNQSFQYDSAVCQAWRKPVASDTKPAVSLFFVSHNTLFQRLLKFVLLKRLPGKTALTLTCREREKGAQTNEEYCSCLSLVAGHGMNL